MESIDRNALFEQTFYSAKTLTHVILRYSLDRLLGGASRVRSAIGIVLVSIVLSFFGSQAEAAGIVYVNVNAPGPAQDGLSWNTGFRSLQVGLSVATPGSQVWVAKGTYLPTTSGDFNASFVLINNVAIFGGFAGTEPATFPLNFRNFLVNQTILSGAIGFPGFNSHHVVEAISGTNATAILDG